MESRETLATQGPYVIAVGGGKGGVGKSVVALNLAVAMAQLGARVSLVDADLGSANLHTMLGIDRPGQTLQALLDGHAQSLNELRIATEIPRLSLVAGSTAVPGAANLQHARKMKLLRHVDKLDADVVIVDCGAGVHFNVIDFFTRADLHLLVATPQLVSLQNAYGFLKACVYRMLHQRAQAAGKAQLFESASDNSEVETLSRLLERLAVNDAELADELRATLDACQFALIGNQLSDPRESKALNALSRMFGDFLTLQVPVLGCLLRRDRIHAAVTRRKPFVLDASDAESTMLMEIAQAYLGMQRSAAAPHRQPVVRAGVRDPFAQAASRCALPPSTTHQPDERQAPSAERGSVREAVGGTQHAQVLPISRAGARVRDAGGAAGTAARKPLRRSL
jgi:flagellar biosynthesis protein FlhG